MTAHLTASPSQNADLLSGIDLTMIITEPIVLSYLSSFADDEMRVEKALEALKVGVIAIQSASPTLDMRVVQSKFDDLESRLKDYVDEFQTAVNDQLGTYFHDGKGVIPLTIAGAFGQDGKLNRTFQSFFDPNEGKLSRLMQSHIGPQSAFGRALDPRNKDGVITLIEGRVQQLVESKLNDVLQQFSLDHDESAMSRLRAMLSEFFMQLNQSLGVQSATAAEAAKGHVKGIVFEEDLYAPFAAFGNQLGDETEFVRGTPGALPRNKKGDFVATLGETAGAPGLRIVVEVKDQPLKLKAAIDELQEAKQNREAAVGIFAFARGSEPPEVGDFRKIGEDFFCTVDKDMLVKGTSLVCFEAAYKIARALAVESARKEAAGELDLQKVHDHLGALEAWADRIADMATKAKTVQNSGKLIEETANSLKQDLEQRLFEITRVLNHAQAT